MAYNLSERFSEPPQYFRILDPGAYQNINRPLIKCNKAPFLANSQRIIKSGAPIWTHAIYTSDIRPKIPNCTALMSKIPRFSYEKFNVKTFEDMICECQDPNVCECEDGDEPPPEILCQANVPRTLFKGPPPRSHIEDGLSSPSKSDDGFEILPDGSQKRIFRKAEQPSPPFYNAVVNESTTFYRGCKWSQWTSQKKCFYNDTPGPAHYTIEHEPTLNEICAEKVRSHKRKTSKQYRFIEMVQRRNILEGRPGPSSYSPNLPKGTDLSFLGPKAPRFTTSQYNICPGPCSHFIKRDFDPPEVPEKMCKAKLPAPAPFGGKALRFKPRKEEGASPASYNSAYKPCQFLRCTKAPFNISTERFKQETIEESDEDVEEESEPIDEETEKEKEKKLPKPVPTWQFKSNVVRIKPLKKVGRKPSHIPEPTKDKRFTKLQKVAPFFSSEGRFRYWFNELPIHAKEKTPGPAYYNIIPPECYPAVKRGPLVRTPRFQSRDPQTPGPNQYKVIIGIENILHTHNQRIKENMEKRHQFHWEPPRKPRVLDNEEKESVLLRESIALLNTIDTTESTGSNFVHAAHIGHDNKKVLRCFADGK